MKIKKCRNIVLVVVVALFVLELSLRLFGVKPQIPLINPAGPYSRHPTRLWGFTPNFDGKWGKVSFKANSLGMRDDEIISMKPTSQTRILVLGGSISAGSFLEESQTYVEMLEVSLKKVHGDIQVMNAGVPGYSTRQELTFFRETGLALQPDMVILDFAINDVLDGRLDAKEFDINPEFRGPGVFLDLTEPPNRRARVLRTLKNAPRYVSTYTIVRWAYRKSKNLIWPDSEAGSFRWIEEQILMETPTPLVEDGWKKTLSEIQQIDELTKSLNIPLVIVMFPLSKQLSDFQTSDRPQRVMATFCEENHIPLVDLLPVFRQKLKEDASVKFFFDADHPTMAGQSLAALTLIKTISPLIPALPEKQNLP